MPTTIPTVTSSTRPGSPSTGDAYFETDTKNYIIYDGASWRSWESDNNFASGSFPSNGHSAFFDGVNDYIDTNNKFDYIQQTCNFSISCWLKFTNYNASTSQNQSIIATTSTSSQKGLYFYYDSRGGNRNLKAMLSANTAVTITASGGVGDNNWHHYAVTCASGGTLNMYKDGSVIANASAPTTTTSTAFHTMNLGVGSSGYGYLTDAYLDEVAIFNRELTSSEIDDIRASPYRYTNYTSLYRLENNANDESGANDGTNNGATFTTSEKPY